MHIGIIEPLNELVLNKRVLFIKPRGTSIHLKFCRPGSEGSALHLQVYSLDGVTKSLTKAYKLFTEGKFSNALQAFNQVLWTIPLVVVSSRREVDEVKELITICRSVIPLCHKNLVLRLQSCWGQCQLLSWPLPVPWDLKAHLFSGVLCTNFEVWLQAARPQPPASHQRKCVKG